MKHNGRGGKGKHEWQDACAALDEARCKVQSFAGNCSWSTEKMLCYGEKSSSHAFPDGTNGSVFDRKNLRSKGKRTTVGFTVRVNNLDYASLRAKQNAKVLYELASAVKTLISLEAGDDVAPKHVDLSFSPGSVIVEVSIKLPASASATVVQDNLSKNPYMLAYMAESIDSIDGIAAVRTGSISVSIIKAPTVQHAASEPSATEEQSGINIGIFIAASILTVALCLVCAFWKPCRSSRKAPSPNPQGVVTSLGKVATVDGVVDNALEAVVVKGVVV